MKDSLSRTFLSPHMCKPYTLVDFVGTERISENSVNLLHYICLQQI